MGDMENLGYETRDRDVAAGERRVLREFYQNNPPDCYECEWETVKMMDGFRVVLSERRHLIPCERHGGESE